MSKSYISWDSWRSLGISEWDEIKYINKCCNGAVLKARTLYKGNVIKYKGKSRKSLFWNFKRLNIFKSCLMALVCIPEVLTDLLTPILPYLTITMANAKCVIYVKNVKNAIFDAYATWHMSNIDMAIWVSKDPSGPQEWRPLPLNTFWICLTA